MINCPTCGQEVDKTDVASVIVNGGFVEIDGKRFTLAMQEIRLMEVLVNRIGKIVPRNVLIEQIYSYGAREPDSAVKAIDVHICNVRKKLGYNSIITIHKQGYMFNPKGVTL